MTPQLRIRSFTNDQYVLDKVFYSNFYKMRGFKTDSEQPVVMDIGAHCGYFTFTALVLGAKKVYAFEPFLENYKMFLNNLSDNRLNEVEIISYQNGIYLTDTRLTFGFPEVQKGSFFDFANISESKNVNSPVSAVHCFSLDNVLANYVGETIDILKISIGYSEMNVLLSSKLIDSQVRNICGESNLDLATQTKFKILMANKGFTQCRFENVPDTEGQVLFHFAKGKLDDAFEK